MVVPIEIKQRRRLEYVKTGVKKRWRPLILFYVKKLGKVFRQRKQQGQKSWGEVTIRIFQEEQGRQLYDWRRMLPSILGCWMVFGATGVVKLPRLNLESLKKKTAQDWALEGGVTTFTGGQRRGQKGDWEGAGREERQGCHRKSEKSGARRSWTVLNASQRLRRMGTERQCLICHIGPSRSHVWVDVLTFRSLQFSSVQFSHSVVSDSLQPHELQHARPPCLSPTPGVHLDSHPLTQWCHPAISSSVIPFLLLPPTPPL